MLIHNVIEDGFSVIGANVFEEVETGRRQQVVFACFIARSLEHWKKEIVFDQESVVKFVLAGNSRFEESKGGCMAVC